ncbi:hypothetical protein EJ02DRAFT_465036 [Clathrospora elynae]|uniref:Uncharacterized protein n=1 Tax=Clathrospora elynae TaxID=706981 RepID=A0A6A5SU40_9PLEO|nr:hypothetical protein EJ02DRAFT_465036 [Clathrospora elynae]
MASSQDYTSMPWSMRSAFDTVTASSVSPYVRLDAQDKDNAALIRQLADSHDKHKKYEARLAKLNVEMRKQIQDLQLARKAKKLDTRETRIKEEDERITMERQELEDARFAFHGSQTEFDGSASIFQDHATDTEDDDRTAPNLLFYRTPNTNKLFEVTDRANFDKYLLPISFEDMNSHHMELLRRHDYYGGCMDCIWIAGQADFIEQGLMAKSDVPHLYDIEHPKNPECAGMNARYLFTRAAMCQIYKPEWNIRLDDRCFDFNALAVPRFQKNKPFRMAYAKAEALVQSSFWKDFI